MPYSFLSQLGPVDLAGQTSLCTTADVAEPHLLASNKTPVATTQRRVILCDFYWTRDKDPRVPLGHGSLLAALRAADIADVVALVRPVNDPAVCARSIVAEILQQTSGLAPSEVDVAMGVYVWSESLVQAVIAGLREQGYEGRIILGGPQVSYAGRGVDALYPGADVFVRGYGEDALVRLVASGDFVEVPGVHFAGRPDAVAQANVDLGSLPSPFLGGLIPLQGQRFIRWETQRGCPFRCSFCQHKEAGATLKHRDLHAERVLAEVDLFCEAKVEDIAVLDPVFNMGKLALQVLRRFSLHKFQGKLSLQCRAETLTQEFLDAADGLNVVLEFGLQTIHSNEGKAIRRRNDADKIDKALQAVRGRGIHHEVSLIYGLPEQTLASFHQTLAWCLERRVPVIKAFPLLLLRGTELESDHDRWGLITGAGPMPMVIASHTFSHNDWTAMACLSEALHHTEGHHPAGLAALIELAQGQTPSMERWRPL